MSSSGHAGALEDLAGRRHGGVEHERGVVAHVAAGHDAGAGLQAVGLGVLLAGVEHGRGAVDDTRRVARVVHVGDVEVGVLLVDELAERGHAVGEPVVGHGGEARCERGQRVGGGAGPGELVVVEGQGAVEVEDRHEAAVEAALGDGDRGAPLRLAACSSRARRSMPSSGAMASAHTPWCDWGWICCRCSLRAPIGRRPFLGSDIISVPPPMVTSSRPAITMAAAKLLAVMPEPQNRSSVTPLARTS